MPSDSRTLSSLDDPADSPPESDAPLQGPATMGMTRSRSSSLRVLRPLVLGALRPAVPLVTLCVIFTAVNGQFLTIPNLRGIVEQNLVIIVAAIGATFVILTGGIDLSIEGVILTSSVVVALLVKNTATGSDLGPWAILIGCLVGALFGVVHGGMHAYARTPSFAVTLGT